MRCCAKSRATYGTYRAWAPCYAGRYLAKFGLQRIQNGAHVSLALPQRDPERGLIGKNGVVSI